MDSRAVLLLVLILALVAGCRTAPAGRIRAGDTEIEQTGPAAVPAAAASKTTRLETTIPPGVTVTAHADGSISWATVAPLALVTTTREASATGPAAFAPPSPADQADGSARRWAWAALLVGGAAAAFGLLKGWPMVGAGGACVAAAAVAVLAVSQVPGWVWTLGTVGVVLAAAGWALWRFYLRDRDASIAAQPRAVT